MKIVKLFIVMFAFCGYLKANDAPIECDKEPLTTINFDLSAFEGFDIHQQVKGFVCLFFSQCSQEGCYAKMFSDPVVKTYIDSLEGLEKKASIQRLYTLAITSEILSNLEVDLETGSLETFRLLLEQEYDVMLPRYSFPQLDIEHRASYAYTLYTANAIAAIDALINFDEIKEILIALNLNSNHSRRMIRTFMKIIPYIALEESSNVFADNDVKLNEVESISIDFHQNKISIQECADRINALFK